MQLIPTVLLAVAAMAVASPVPVNAEHEVLRREPVANPETDGSVSWGGLPDWKRWWSQGAPTWIEEAPTNEKRTEAETDGSVSWGGLPDWKRWWSQGAPTWIEEAPTNEERSEEAAKGPSEDWQPWGSPTWRRET